LPARLLGNSSIVKAEKTLRKDAHEKPRFPEFGAVICFPISSRWAIRQLQGDSRLCAGPFR
jgi:hypothetical protein